MADAAEHAAALSEVDAPLAALPDSPTTDVRTSRSGSRGLEMVGAAIPAVSHVGDPELDDADVESPAAIDLLFDEPKTESAPTGWWRTSPSAPSASSASPGPRHEE